MLATTVESSVTTQEELQTLRRREFLLLRQHLVRPRQAGSCSTSKRCLPAYENGILKWPTSIISQYLFADGLEGQPSAHGQN